MALVVVMRALEAVFRRRARVAYAVAFGILLACSCNRAAHDGASSANAEASAAVEPGPSAQQQPKPTKGAGVLSKAQAEQLAARWMDALRQGDKSRLQELSALPFALHEPAEYVTCQTTTVDQRAQIPGALSCLLDDQLLMDELRAQPKPVTEELSRSALPQWAARLRKSSAKEPGQTVQVELPGDGVSYHFVLVVTQAGVASVWKYAEFDPN